MGRSNSFFSEIKRKSIISTSVLFFVVITILTAGFISIIIANSIQSQNNNNLYKIRLNGIQLLIEADRDAYQSRLALSEIFMSPVLNNQEKRESAFNAIKENNGQNQDRFTRFRKLVENTFYQGSSDFKSFDANQEKWLKYTDEIIALLMADKTAQAYDLYHSDYAGAFDPMRESMNTLTERMQEDSSKEYRQNRGLINGILVVSIISLLALCLLIALSIVVTRFLFKADDRKTYYESILDAVPLPITVTDMDMKWTFVNKAVEGMLGVNRHTVYGKHCSEWKADICNTEKCGIAMLRKGFSSSEFVNKGSDHYYKTTVSYIQGRKGEKIGHIEIVTDIDSEKKVLNLASKVKQAVKDLESSARQFSSAAQSLSQGAAEQASSLEEITASITEINSQAKQNLENATAAEKISRQAKENAQTGNIQIKGLVEAMVNINQSADGIKKLAKTIDNIAFQINLLALNANVEAARAGKYGKGFAVVAEEVRNLAVRSATSVKEATELVDASLKSIKEGTSLAEKTSEQMDSIVSDSSRVSVIASEVMVASKEQSTGLDQIHAGLQQIDQATQSATANAEETASASVEMTNIAVYLNNMTAGFNIDSSLEKNAETLGTGNTVCLPGK